MLLVDIGNSRIKWAVATPDAWRGGYAATLVPGDSAEIGRFWRRLARPERVVVSNVGGAAIEQELNAWCAAHWELLPQYLRPTEPVPGLVNLYHEPSQLGADRWAAVIGAQALVGVPAVVVDCGTAVTIDVVDEKNRFLGGLIMVGLDLARRSLLHETERILEAGDAPTTVLGRSTAECLASGVYYGLSGGIDRAIQEVHSKLESPPNVLLTGGDARRVQPFLHHTVSLEPELVLRGLAALVERDEMGVRRPGVG